jgi:predicted RNA binding protein YcfA (HicA-like mRNA interferase family)
MYEEADSRDLPDEQDGNPEQTEDEIIDEYVNRRRLIQQSIEYLLFEISDEFFTMYNLPNAKMILYSIGTDQLASELLERYKLAFDDWEKKGLDFNENANGMVLIFLLEKIFCSPLIVYPIDDYGVFFAKAIRDLKKRFDSNDKLIERFCTELENIRADIEENHMTEDQAQEYFDQIPEISKKTAKTFGSAIDDLNEVSLDPEIEDIDLMLLQGKSELTEAVRYVQLLPEFGDIYDTGNLIADQLVEKLTERFNAWLSNGFDHAMEHAFKAIKDLQYVYGEVNPLVTIKTQFLLYVFTDTIDKFLLFLIRYYAKENNCSIKEANNQIRKNYILIFGSDGDLMDEVKRTGKQIFRAEYFAKHAGGLIKEALKDSDEPTKEVLDNSYDDLVEILNLRVVPTTKSKFGDIYIKSQRVNSGDLMHYLHATAYDSFILGFDNYGDEAFEVSIRINRFTGELTIAQGNLDFSKFIDRSTYNKLKKLAYEHLIDASLQSDELVPEVIPKISPIEVLQEETAKIAAGIAEALITHEPEIAQEEEVKELKPDTAYEEKVKKRRRTRIPELNGTEVFRVLTKIIGQKPEKPSSGSHYQYPRKVGNGTYSVPFHKSDAVGKGLLLKCLRNLGIKRQEFLDNF